jgi:hypothetical protein
MNGKLNGMLSDSIIETLWETLIALATTAGICLGVISLAGHLNEARAARSGAPSVTAGAPTTGVTALSKIDQNKIEAALNDGDFR